MKKVKTLKIVEKTDTLDEAVEALRYRRRMDSRAKDLEKELMEFAKMKGMGGRPRSEEQRQKDYTLLLAAAEMLAGPDYIELLKHAASLNIKRAKSNGTELTISG